MNPSVPASAALLAAITRVAEALERLAPPPPASVDLSAADAFVWHPSPAHLAPVPAVSRVDIGLLQGVARQKAILLDNTLRFARGYPANNAMLWGARGMGKSSLVKAAHAQANAERPGSLALIEIHREDIATLPELLRLLRGETRRCLIFCDDLSFERRGCGLQGAEIGAGWRDRGAAGERCCSMPPATGGI